MNKKILIAIFLVALIGVFSAYLLARTFNANADSMYTLSGRKTLVLGEEWFPGGGYSIYPQAIDVRSNPRQVWLILRKNGVKVDDAVVASGGTYNYTGETGTTTFSTKVDSIFAGATSNMVQLINTSISLNVIATCVKNWQCDAWSECTNNVQYRSCYDANNCGDPLAAGQPALTQSCDKRTLTVGETYYPGGGYSITAQAIDARANPRQVWLTLSKNDVKVDEKIATTGQYLLYSEPGSGTTTFSTRVDIIFAGATNDMVQLKPTVVRAASIAACSVDWQCSDWSACSSLGLKTRSCSDAAHCGNFSGKPAISSSCGNLMSVCAESWSCGDWSACAGGQQSRTCTDTNACGTTASKPSTTQSCAVCSENWSCGDWSACSGGQQSRTCTDANACGTTTSKPATVQSCTAGPTSSETASSSASTGSSGQSTGTSGTTEEAWEKLEQKLVSKIDQALISRLKGRILLQIEAHGEAWYLETTKDMKFYLKNGVAAYQALRKFGLGITNVDLAKIPVGIENRFVDIDSDNDGLSDKLEEGLKTDPAKPDTDGDGLTDGYEIKNGSNPLGAGKLSFSKNLAGKLTGRILLQVESRGEAWYLNPKDGKRYYMKDGDAAYQIMRFLSLGIKNIDLRKIPVGEF